MTNKSTIKAEIKRTKSVDTIVQSIELSTVDDEGYEQYVGIIYVDEIEISEDFVKYLYKGIENKKPLDK